MTDRQGPGRPGEPARDLGIENVEGAVEIGRGGFAVVYRARQPALNRQVAIKLLAPADATNQRRFEREGRAMGTLSGHPNIVNVLETGVTAEGQPYIVMTYLSQGSLADRVAHEGPLPWTEVARIGVTLAGALETAHRSGMLHRDVKPENVLLSDYGEAQLTDFGIARVEGHSVTVDSSITASVAHAAPEVLDGQPATAASDVYALGSTLATLLAGHPPFGRRPGEELVGQILRIAGDPLPDLRPHGVPDALCRVLEQAMAKDPAQRQPSAAELGRQLQEAQRRAGLPVTDMPLVLPDSSSRTPGGDRAAGALAAGSGELTEEPGPAAATPATTARRPRAVALGVTAAGVAVLAVLILAVSSGREPADEVLETASSTTVAPTTTTAGIDLEPTIAVGDDPNAVVSASIGERSLVFVANSGSRSVSVIDAATDETVTTIELSSRPTGIAVNPRSNQLFITNAEAVLTVVDGTTFQEMGTIELPARPTGITVNHRRNRVYVTSSEKVVWVLDGATSELVTTIETSSTPAGVDINPQTNRIYVAGPDEGALWVIDGSTDQIVATVAVGASACGVAANPRSNLVYVTRAGTGELVAASGETDEVVTTVAVGPMPCGVDINPEVNRIYVASQPEGTVTVVDGERHAVVGTRRFPPGPAGGGPLLADVSTDPDTGRVYVVSRSADALAVLSEG